MGGLLAWSRGASVARGVCTGQLLGGLGRLALGEAL